MGIFGFGVDWSLELIGVDKEILFKLWHIEISEEMVNAIIQSWE